ncbi:MAG: hypothetical protein KDK36_19565, partial [Leptospiraceae bacterium]|nr:hypothetical protein [Leptospiraceae bacterium]
MLNLIIKASTFLFVILTRFFLTQCSKNNDKKLTALLPIIVSEEDNSSSLQLNSIQFTKGKIVPSFNPNNYLYNMVVE